MRSLLSLLCLGVGACGFSPANIANTKPNYAKPAVARSEVPLTLILDPQTVHDDMVLSGFSPAAVQQVNLVVTRDIKSALEVYFSPVTISTPESAAKVTGQQVVTNVKIDALGWKSVDGNQAGVGTMAWSVSMRFADQPKFFYQFTEHTVGKHAISDLSETDALIQGVLEEGMLHLLKDMDAKGVQALVAPADAPKAPEPSSESPEADNE